MLKDLGVKLWNYFFYWTVWIIILYSFLGAIEKQKLVYILNRDAEARLTISSPLEAHKSNTLVYHMVGVDVGFENPMFACLEIDYEEADSDPTGKILYSSNISRIKYLWGK